MKDIEYIKNKIIMKLDLLPETLMLLEKLKYEDIQGLGIENANFEEFSRFELNPWASLIEGIIMGKYIDSLGAKERDIYFEKLENKYYK